MSQSKDLGLIPVEAASGEKAWKYSPEHFEGRIAKDAWGAGPWQAEPDKLQWKTRAGLVGLIVRSISSGGLCGYVGVPPGHPVHGKDYSDVDADVHGGLTFGSGCSPGGLVCHVAERGEPEHVFWFGFDCAHSGDLSPAQEAFFRSRLPGLARGEEFCVYRDVRYVRREVERLAEQLATVRG